MWNFAVSLHAARDPPVWALVRLFSLLVEWTLILCDPDFWTHLITTWPPAGWRSAFLFHLGGVTFENQRNQTVSSSQLGSEVIDRYGFEPAPRNILDDLNHPHRLRDVDEEFWLCALGDRVPIILRLEGCGTLCAVQYIRDGQGTYYPMPEGDRSFEDSSFWCTGLEQDLITRSFEIRKCWSEGKGAKITLPALEVLALATHDIEIYTGFSQGLRKPE